MLLSNEERAKFIEWCKQESDSNKAIIGQMEKMKLPDVMVRAKRAELMAVTIVGKMLSEVEGQTING